MSSINLENFEDRLATVMESVDDAEHRAQILEYIHERRANGLRLSTLMANANVLRTFANKLAKPFDDASRADLNAYANARAGQRVFRSYDKDGKMTEVIRPCVKGDSTMDHHKVIIRGFYKWRNGGDEYPDCVRHLKTRTAKKSGVITDRLISREELQQLQRVAGEPRLKALVSFMWEAGFRAGEVVALNVGSVTFDEYGAKVAIPAKATGLKTGARTVRVLPNESAPHLQAWLEMHPFKTDPDAPLFHGTSRRNPCGRMLPSSLYAVIQRLVKHAGIKRHIKPHDFRHTAATEKARLGYTEAQLRHFFGWSRTSDMPSHYVHLAGADFERMMLEKHGIKVEEKRDRPVMFAPCPRCNHTNDTTNLFCGNCRVPLTPGAEEKVVERQNEGIMALVEELVEERVRSILGAA